MTGHSEKRIGQKQVVYLTVFLFWHAPEAMIYYYEFLNFLENYNRKAKARSALTYALRKCHDATCGVMLFYEKYVRKCTQWRIWQKKKSPAGW